MKLEIEKDKRSKDQKGKDREVQNLWTLVGAILSKIWTRIFIPIFLPNWEDWIFVDLKRKLSSATNFLSFLPSQPNTLITHFLTYFLSLIFYPPYFHLKQTHPYWSLEDGVLVSLNLLYK